MPSAPADNSELPTNMETLSPAPGTGGEDEVQGALKPASLPGRREWGGGGLGASAPAESAWAEQKTSPNLLPFGARYAAKEQLGLGGMGEVQILRDSWIGREVAGKFLHVRFQHDPAVRARFMREACLQGRLEHPSIVPVHDVGVAPDGRPYFTMKRIRGMTLRAVISGLRARNHDLLTRFSRRKLLSAFSNVCLSIAFAHEHGVVHRDLKPANVMLGDYGETYVLDWGIAKFVGVPDHEGSLTDESSDVLLDRFDRTILGTPGYMAPEQISGPQDRVTTAADVYALGALLFELLTYERLHPGSDPDELCRATLEGADARASVRCPELDVPPELEAICVKATALSPQNRFASVREMHDALERFLDGDRDTMLRRELADAHILAADAAQQEARRSDPDGEVRYRSLAINALGRALALESDNVRAMRRLVSMLLEPPSFVPKEAAEAVDEKLRHGQQVASQFILIGSCLIFFGLGLEIQAGIRDWATMALIAVNLVVGIGSQAFVLLSRSPNRALQHLSVVVSAVATTLSSRMFGPLFFTCSILLMFMVPISINPDRGVRTSGFLLCVLGTVLTEGLEVAGFLSPSYEFTDGKLIILPHVLDFPPLMTHVLVITANLLFLMLVAFGVNRFRQGMKAAEERSQLYAWQLRQLLPKESRLSNSFQPGLAARA